ncbi:hypothetical protein PMI06_006619 [Burkholderia sp. BT03]|nr:hypothetical protein PMI06_006619 [Burkholderia sp. BT03]SKC93891.1 hypothetical protein SAMN06266956_5807 [Paraburkholderia hospita]
MLAISLRLVPAGGLAYRSVFLATLMRRVLR